MREKGGRNGTEEVDEGGGRCGSNNKEDGRNGGKRLIKESKHRTSHSFPSNPPHYLLFFLSFLLEIVLLLVSKFTTVFHCFGHLFYQ